MHEMLKVQEVADLLRLSKATVQRWCAAGKLPALKLGQQWRIDANALREMLARQATRLAEDSLSEDEAES